MREPMYVKQDSQKRENPSELLPAGFQEVTMKHTERETEVLVRQY
jgi:hypothetical protein